MYLQNKQRNLKKGERYMLYSDTTKHSESFVFELVSNLNASYLSP